MHELEVALEEMKTLHEKVFGRPAPPSSQLSNIPYSPGPDPVREALEEVRSLKELWQRSAGMPRPASWTPLADCHATDGEFVVRMEIPGVSREDLKVHLVGSECVVRGERKSPHAPELRVLSLERPWGFFERRFLLPAGGRTSEMKARLSAGLLEIRIPVEKPGLEREQPIEVD